MPQACCAAQCNHTGKNCKLKNFPSDPERALLWESNLNRADWERKPYHRLCKCHFDADQFEARREDGLRKLRPDAVPLLFPTHSISRKHSSDTYKEIIELSSKYRMIDEPEIKEETSQLDFPVANWPLEHVPETEESIASKGDHRFVTDSEKSNSYKLLRALQLMPVHVDSSQIPRESLESLENQDPKLRTQDLNALKVSSASVQDIIPFNNEDDHVIHNKTKVESSGEYYCDRSVIIPPTVSEDCTLKKGSREVPEDYQKMKEFSEQKKTHSSNMKIQLPDTYKTVQTPAINLKLIRSQLGKLGAKEARRIKASNVQCKKVLLTRSQLKLLVNSSSLCKSPSKASADNSSLPSGISLPASKTKPVTKTAKSTVGERVSLAQKNVISSSVLEQLHKTTAENLPRPNNCKRYKRNVMHPLSQAISKNFSLTNGGKSQLLLLDSNSDHVKEFLSHLNSVSGSQPQPVAIDELHSKNESVFTSDFRTISGETSNRSVANNDSQLEIISNTGLKETSSKMLSGTSPQPNSLLGKRKSSSRKTSLVATSNTNHQNSSQQGLNHFASSETETPTRNKLQRRCLVTERPPSALSPKSKPQLDKNTAAKKEVKCGQSNVTTSKNQKRQSKELQVATTDFEKPSSWLRQCISYLEQSDEPSTFSEIETVLTLSECSKDDIQEYLKHLAKSENLLDNSSQKDAELLKPVSGSSQPAHSPADENSPRIKDAEYFKPVSDVKFSEPAHLTPVENSPRIKEEVESPGSEEIYSLKSEMKQMQDEVQKLKNELREKTEQLERMEKALKVFNPDQLRLLFAGNVKKWSDETIVKASQIKTACGSSGYKLLVEQGWPIPCLSALDKRLQKTRQSAPKTQS